VSGTVVIGVTGAGGFIGSRVLGALLANENVRVVGLSRRSRQMLQHPRVRWHSGDLVSMTSADLAEFVYGTDVLLHLAAAVHVRRPTRKDGRAIMATNVDASLRLAQASVAAGVRHLVFTSSISVYGRATDDVVFQRTAPIRPTSTYALSKARAEEALRSVEGSLGVSILRCPLVYGAEDPGNFGLLLGAVSRGLPLPLLADSGRRSVLAVENLAHLCAMLAVSSTSPTGTFNVCDGEAIPTRQVVRMIASAMDRSDARVLPERLTRTLRLLPPVRQIVEKLNDSLRFEWQRSHDELRWTPPLSTEVAIRAETYRYLTKKQVHHSIN
jgi:nucleoside-diphosphate-sugar epimerase